MSTVNELREHARLLECRAAFIGDDNTGPAQMERDALDAAARLLEREACALETLGTHWAGCWSAGRDHYQCALNEIERLRKRNEQRQREVDVLADLLKDRDNIRVVAEHFVHTAPCRERNFTDDITIDNCICGLSVLRERAENAKGES